MLDLWNHLDTIIAEFPDAAPLGQHGLGGIAAWRMRTRGQPVPEELARYERGAAYASVTAAPLLTRIVEALDEDVLVLKGPENAALYPQPILRTYGDLDLLVHDLPAATNKLIAAGFHSDNIDYSDMAWHQHESPLTYPGLALAVELHRHPGFLAWSTPPSNWQLLQSSVPSVTGVPRARALPPVQHLLHLISHAWRHTPYCYLIHLVDIELLRQQVDPAELNQTTARWGLERVVARTFRAIDRFIYRLPADQDLLDRIWSRHLRAHRGQTLAEHYAGEWLKGIAAPTPREQIEAISTDIHWSFQPHTGQTNRTKAKRILRALRATSTPLTQFRSEP